MTGRAPGEQFHAGGGDQIGHLAHPVGIGEIPVGGETTVVVPVRLGRLRVMVDRQDHRVPGLLQTEAQTARAAEQVGGKTFTP